MMRFSAFLAQADTFYASQKIIKGLVDDGNHPQSQAVTAMAIKPEPTATNNDFGTDD